MKQTENLYYLVNPEISLDDLSKVEMIKAFSNFLRGNIKEELQNDKPYFNEETTQIIKFHGFYQQDDRDRRVRTKEGLQKYHQLMVRCRISSGLLTKAQYLALDKLCNLYGNKTLRFTTRQTIQFHGVLKRDIKNIIKEINQIYLTTSGTCGDIVRNVTGPINPSKDLSIEKVHTVVNSIADHFKSKAKAYAEIWLDEEPISPTEEDEPIYSTNYLPRKFKIAVTKAGYNTNHFFTNDMGIAVDFHENDISGYYFYAGGGMGQTHNDNSTYPRLSSYLGWVSKESLLPVAEAIVKVQKDYGNRKDRKHARLKYLIDERGLNWFRNKVEEYANLKFFIREEPLWKDIDYLGWTRASNQTWTLGIFVMAGRVEGVLKEILKTIAENYNISFQITPEQNLLIYNIKDEERYKIEKLFLRYRYDYKPEEKVFHKSIACPALPTCGLAITEAERTLPKILGIIHEKLVKYGMENKSPIFRMTGCPNGCANPYTAEIALVGRSKDIYSLYIGGSRDGIRLAKKITDTMTIPQFEEFIDKLFFYWSKMAKEQYLGDFVNEMFNFVWLVQPIASNYNNHHTHKEKAKI